MKTKLLYTLLLSALILLWAIGFWVGAIYTSSTSPPAKYLYFYISSPPRVIETVKTITETEYVQVPYEVKVPVIKYVDVEKVVKVPVYLELTDWQSLDELKTFLSDYRSEIVIPLQAGRDGTFNFDGQCVAYAMGLRDLAVKYGKNIEMSVVTPSEYYRVFKSRKSSYHMVNSVVINQTDIYYIDAETGDIGKVGYIP